jgi:RNA polymerase sigma-70 factor (ECF subfamily)
MNDPLAFSAPLIRRVYAYVAYRVGDGPDAEDITGMVFERALRYRDSFDPRRGDPASWLIGIARRCMAEGQVRPEVPLERVPDLAIPSHDEPSNTRAHLEAAMKALDPRDRELVALRYGSDLTAKQIAQLMEMKTNAVEVALHRALGRLRSAMTDGGSEQRLREVGIRRAAADTPMS